MTLRTLEAQDCFNIIKTFERGSAYATSEESVYAALTPLLSGMRTQSQSVVDQLESEENLALSQETISGAMGGSKDTANISNLDKAHEDDNIVTKLMGNFVPDSVGKPGVAPSEIDDVPQPAGILGNAFNSECIPCGDRINMIQEFNLKKALDVQSGILEHYLGAFEAQLNQLKSIVDMLQNPSQYVDLCALLQFLNDFVCIPDLQRIISLLMALLSRVSFDISLSFDLIMGLVGLLVAPMISALVNTLHSYVLLIVGPINCIIDALQNVTRKLDYNVLFQNIDYLDTSIGIGSATPVKVAKNELKLPLIGDPVISIDSTTLPPTGRAQFNFNVLTDPVANIIKDKNVQTQNDVNVKAADYQKARNKSARVDMSDPVAVAAWKKELSVAQKEYVDAIASNNQSVIGKMVNDSEHLQSGLNRQLFHIISLLEEGVQAVLTFFNKMLDESKHIINAYIGGGDQIILSQIHKLWIVQVIAFIGALIQAMATGGLKCEADAPLQMQDVNPTDNFNIITDESGQIHITTNPDKHRDMVNAILGAVGGKQSRVGAVNNNAVQDAVLLDKGEGGAMQNLIPLIEFTGDPIIDTQVYGTMQTLVTPQQLVFRCPLQRNSGTTNQINQWIRELALE